MPGEPVSPVRSMLSPDKFLPANDWPAHWPVAVQLVGLFVAVQEIVTGSPTSAGLGVAPIVTTGGGVFTTIETVSVAVPPDPEQLIVYVFVPDELESLVRFSLPLVDLEAPLPHVPPADWQEDELVEVQLTFIVPPTFIADGLLELLILMSTVGGVTHDCATKELVDECLAPSPILT